MKKKINKQTLTNLKTLTKTKSSSLNSKINLTTLIMISKHSLMCRVATYCISCLTSLRKNNSSSNKIRSSSSSLKRKMINTTRLNSLIWQILKMLNKTMIIKHKKTNRMKVIRRWNTSLIRMK